MNTTGAFGNGFVLVNIMLNVFCPVVYAITKLLLKLLQLLPLEDELLLLELDEDELLLLELDDELEEPPDDELLELDEEELLLELDEVLLFTKGHFGISPGTSSKFGKDTQIGRPSLQTSI